MPDEVKNALMARELKGKDDSETERLRRKYVRDMIATNTGRPFPYDERLPRDKTPAERRGVDLALENRRGDNDARERKAKFAQERATELQEAGDRYRAGLPQEPIRNDINLPVEKPNTRKRENARQDLKDDLDAQERNQAARSRAAKGWR